MKTGRTRAILRTLAGVALLVVMYRNLEAVRDVLASPPSIESGEIVARENQFLPIRVVLEGEGYFGDLEYITAGSLKGREVTRTEGVHFVQISYIAIPRNLVRDRPDLPWVLGDFSVGDPKPDTPEGLIEYYDPGNGLILYKRKLRE